MKTTHAIPKELWCPFSLENHASRGFSMGPLRLWVRRDGDDWLALVDRDGNSESVACSANLDGQAPEEGAWRRLGSVDACKELKVLPVMPDRPVVVRPEVPYTILPGEKIQFYVGVPLWLALQTVEHLTLLAEPIMQLSNTWFGNPMDGELGYAMRTRARRQIQDLDFHPWRAICPVRIRNLSKDTLTFERICLRVQHLDLYVDAKEGIWANESGVTIRGDNNWSRISHARGAPPELSSPTLLAKARDEIRGGFSLKALTGAGGFFQ